jgi:hypothetical protein
MAAESRASSRSKWGGLWRRLGASQTLIADLFLTVTALGALGVVATHTTFGASNNGATGATSRGVNPTTRFYSSGADILSAVRQIVATGSVDIYLGLPAEPTLRLMPKGPGRNWFQGLPIWNYRFAYLDPIEMSLQADNAFAEFIRLVDESLSSASAAKANVTIHAPTPRDVYATLARLVSESREYRIIRREFPRDGRELPLDLLFPSQYRGALEAMQSRWTVIDLDEPMRDLLIVTGTSILTPVPDGPDTLRDYIAFKYDADIGAAVEAIKKGDSRHQELVARSLLDRDDESLIDFRLTYERAVRRAVFIETDDPYIRSRLLPRASGPGDR